VKGLFFLNRQTFLTEDDVERLPKRDHVEDTFDEPTDVSSEDSALVDTDVSSEDSALVDTDVSSQDSELVDTDVSSEDSEIIFMECLKEDKRLKTMTNREIFEIYLHRIVENIGLLSFLTNEMTNVFDMREILCDLFLFYFDIEKINKLCNKDYFLESMHEIISSKMNDIEKVKSNYTAVDPNFYNIRQIMERLKVPTKEKDDRAHVMTPIYIVIEMMKNIPDTFWKNKNKRVLDPCCGYGIFTLITFFKFNHFLTETIRDNEERVRWILYNCLIFSDLVKYNVKVTELLLQYFCNKIVGREVHGLRFNSFVGNVLSISYPCCFHLVTTNPPFHRQQHNNGKKGGGSALWDKIIVHCVENLLCSGGNLLVVHPAGWRKPKSVHSKFTQQLFNMYTKDNQLLYLSIHDTKEGQNAFYCGTRYDIVFLEKTPRYKKTVILDEKGVRSEINLKNWSWIPNSNFKAIRRLLPKGGESTCPIVYSATIHESRQKYVSSTEDDNFQYPLIHSTPKKGVRKMYSKKNDLGHFGVRKVIFGETGIHNAIIDMKGEFGMTQQAMAICVSNRKEAKAVKRALESAEFKNILQACSWSNFRIDWRMFKSFKKDWYKYFN
jgi:hypothetical protein